MGCLDFAAGFIVVFLLLKRLYLRLGENAALGGGDGFKRLQTVFEVRQINRTPEVEMKTPSLPSSSAMFSKPVLCLIILVVEFDIAVFPFLGWCAPPSKRTTNISFKRCAVPIPALWEGDGDRSHQD
jgi:hypothetical protein